MAIVLVNFLANTASIITGSKEAETAVVRAATKMSGAAVAAAKATATAAALAGGAVAALAMRQAHAIDENVKMARSLGLSLPNYTSLALVADEAGVAQDKLFGIIGRSQKAILEAARGTQTYTREFDTLGLSVDKLIRQSPADQFNEILGALSKIENPTVRNATAMNLFGRQGLSVINMLGDMKGKLADADAFTQKFNISLSDVDAAKVEEANDTFGRVGRAIGGLGNVIAVQVSPLITAMSNQILDAGVSGKTFGIAISETMEIAGDSIDLVRQASLGLEAIFLKSAQVIFSLQEKMAASMLKLAEFESKVFKSKESKENLDRRRQSLSELRSYVEATKDSYASLQAKAAGFKTTSEKIAEIQKAATQRAQDAISSNSGGGLSSDVDAADDAIKRATKSTSGLSNQFTKVKKSVRDLREENARMFTDFTQQIANAAGSVDGLRSVLVQTVLDFANSMLSIGMGGKGTGGLGGFLANGLSQGIFVSQSGTAGFSSRSFGELASSAIAGAFGPGFATGGIANRPSIFGEAGPEAAVPLPDGRRIPVDLRGAKGAGNGGTYYIDARGADSAGLARLEAMIREVNGSVEKRSVAAVADRFKRSGNFLR